MTIADDICWDSGYIDNTNIVFALIMLRITWKHINPIKTIKNQINFVLGLLLMNDNEKRWEEHELIRGILGIQWTDSVWMK
jgi:hypothetical protein